MHVDPIKPTLKAPVTMRLILQYDELLSNVAFNFNLRRCSKAHGWAWEYQLNQLSIDKVEVMSTSRVMVGRCMLPVSKPELKARLVSALETKMWWTAFKRCFQIQPAPLHHGGGHAHRGGHPQGTTDRHTALCLPRHNI